MIDLSKCSDQELKEELERRGYCTSALWSDEDVHIAVNDLNEENGTNYAIKTLDCMDILHMAVGKDADHSGINEDIAYLVRQHFKEEIED